MRHALARTLLLSALSLPLAAQGNVWIVDENQGPGFDFVHIHDAVFAAADGDTVLVRSGGYAPFLIEGKSVDVLADAGAQVNVSGWPGFGIPMDIRNTPAGSTTLVRGLDFNAPSLSPTVHAAYCVLVDGCQGTVWFEDCNFTEGTSAPIRVNGCEDVVFERCSAVGSKGYSAPSASKNSSPGMRVSASRVTIHGGSFTGGEGKNGGLASGWAAPGLPGIHMTSGELYLGHAAAIGGAGGSGTSGTCASTSPDGGPGVLAEDGVVRALEAGLIGGPAGVESFICPPASPGPPYALGSATLVQLQGVASHLSSNSPVREGETLTMRLTTTPGQSLTALLLAGQATAPAFAAQLAGVSLLGGPTRRIELGTVDPATGIVTIPITVPELGAGVLAAPWIFQAYVCGSGTCTAGAATHTLWLDASL
jgi:hypothetical protein